MLRVNLQQQHVVADERVHVANRLHPAYCQHTMRSMLIINGWPKNLLQCTLLKVVLEYCQHKHAKLPSCNIPPPLPQRGSEIPIFTFSISPCKLTHTLAVPALGRIRAFAFLYSPDTCRREGKLQITHFRCCCVCTTFRCLFKCLTFV